MVFIMLHIGLSLNKCNLTVPNVLPQHSGLDAMLTNLVPWARQQATQGKQPLLCLRLFPVPLLPTSTQLTDSISVRQVFPVFYIHFSVVSCGFASQKTTMDKTVVTFLPPFALSLHSLSLFNFFISSMEVSQESHQKIHDVMTLVFNNG